MLVEFNKILPPAYLREYIMYFWSMEYHGKKGDGYSERFIPGGSVQIGFDFEERLAYEASNLGKRTRPKAFVEGLFAENFFLHYSHKIRSFGVLFHPGKFHLFSNFRFKEVDDPVVPIEEVWGKEVEHLFERLALAGSDEERVNILSNDLFRRLIYMDNHNESFVRISGQIFDVKRNKLPNPKEISDCCSNRHVRRVFNEFTGISPKRFERIVRLERTVKAIVNARSATLTQTCLNHGYFDQSHFIRDFRQIAGTSPRKYLQENKPLAHQYFCK